MLSKGVERMDLDLINYPSKYVYIQKKYFGSTP